jgi:hypothetical protein
MKHSLFFFKKNGGHEIFLQQEEESIDNATCPRTVGNQQRLVRMNYQPPSYW